MQQHKATPPPFFFFFFFSFSVECVSWYWVDRSDWKKPKKQKNSQEVLQEEAPGNLGWR